MFSGVVSILLIFIINLIYYLIPLNLPNITFFDIILFQIFTNCIFLFYFVLPDEHSEFNKSQLN
jgi:hypothetical protein